MAFLGLRERSKGCSLKEQRQYARRYEEDDGRGQVRDPQHDGRLKQNRDRGVSMSGNGNGSRTRYDKDEQRSSNRSRSQTSSQSRQDEEDDQPRRSARNRSSSTRHDEDDDARPGGQGRVKDPENDNRLRQNRAR